MDRWERIADLDRRYTSAAGREYLVSIEGLPRHDGTWAGRVRFAGGADVRVTDQETSQPNRNALAYWATGLESVFLDGAFERAKVA
jgi:hypothetical protein